MFPVLLSLALYEPTLLPGGGVALPNSLGTLVSTFSGRAFGADAPGAGSEWQVEVDHSALTVTGSSSALGLTVHRQYRFEEADDQPFGLRISVTDRFIPSPGASQKIGGFDPYLQTSLLFTKPAE